MSEEMDLQTFETTEIDDAYVALCGKVFHSREAVAGKARSSMVEKRGVLPKT